MRSTLLLSALCGLSTAHFVMLSPESIGFSDDDESTAPCGGFTPDLDKDTAVDFHVGGEALAMKLTHPEAHWLFRATTDAEAKTGWEQLFPIVQQTGIGEFCEPAVTVADSWVGKKGVVSVVSGSEDGQLYQCVVVNFVKGVGEQPDACKNATGVTADFSDDEALMGLLGNGTASNDTAKDEGSAAGSLRETLPMGVLGLGNMVAMLSIVFVGGVWVF